MWFDDFIKMASRQSGYQNIVLNGNINGNIDNWVKLGGGSSAYEDGEIKVITSSGPSGAIQSILIDKTKPHYVCGKVNYVSGSNARVRIGKDSGTNPFLKDLSPSSAPGWVLTSAILTVAELASITTGITFYLRSEAATAYFDDLACIDISSISAENQNTAWCDANVYPSIIW